VPEIRDIQPKDHRAALVMNNAAVPAVNPHDRASFVELLAIADRTWVVDDDGVLGGLLVSFAPGSTYASANYGWLSDRYGDFGYVDRIVVAPSHRRMGLAGRLYGALADHAAAKDRRRLLCEVNVEPPNPQSLAFHEAAGWRPIDDLEHGPGKIVRFFERPL
jgi:predicted GNAT superfamily acetyltransferase